MRPKRNENKEKHQKNLSNLRHFDKKLENGHPLSESLLLHNLGGHPQGHFVEMLCERVQIWSFNFTFRTVPSLVQTLLRLYFIKHFVLEECELAGYLLCLKIEEVRTFWG
jgi:hypothetical protein